MIFLPKGKNLSNFSGFSRLNPLNSQTKSDKKSHGKASKGKNKDKFETVDMDFPTSEGANGYLSKVDFSKYFEELKSKQEGLINESILYTKNSLNEKKETLKKSSKEQISNAGKYVKDSSKNAVYGAGNYFKDGAKRRVNSAMNNMKKNVDKMMKRAVLAGGFMVFCYAVGSTFGSLFFKSLRYGEKGVEPQEVPEGVKKTDSDNRFRVD